MTLAYIIKLEKIITDDPSLGLQPWLASSIMTVSDAPNCSVTYDHHYDDCNSFIIQATESSKNWRKDRRKKIDAAMAKVYQFTFNWVLPE